MRPNDSVGNVNKKTCRNTYSFHVFKSLRSRFNIKTTLHISKIRFFFVFFPTFIYIYIFFIVFTYFPVERSGTRHRKYTQRP